jgi:hypothetical protein
LISVFLTASYAAVVPSFTGVFDNVNPFWAKDFKGPKIDSVALVGTSKNVSGIFTERDVRKHVEFQLNAEGFQYAPNLKTSFHCVDARTDSPIFGTPGGDLAEFSLALTVHFNSTGKTPDYASIKQLFQKFLNDQASKKRPFFFHTDDTRLGLVFKNVSALLNRNVTVLPSTTPPSEEKQIWLRELSESYAQGCGHIRLMIDSPKLYGLTDNRIIKSLIQVYYEEWWSRSTEEKEVLNLVINLGPLLGKAIGIVNNTGHSADSSPMIQPSIGGSTLFVYHATPASKFREMVLAPFFAKGSQLATFYKRMEDLFTTQLTATITNLSPANQVDLFDISIKN